ncbi:hypothetical protein Hanom_Chr03g00197351 [Helianthus anomalus]
MNKINRSNPICLNMLKQVLVSQALSEEHHRLNPPTAAAKPTSVRRPTPLCSSLSFCLSLSSFPLRSAGLPFPLRSAGLPFPLRTLTAIPTPVAHHHHPGDGGGGPFIH